MVGVFNKFRVTRAEVSRKTTEIARLCFWGQKFKKKWISKKWISKSESQTNKSQKNLLAAKQHENPRDDLDPSKKNQLTSHSNAPILTATLHRAVKKFTRFVATVFVSRTVRNSVGIFSAAGIRRGNVIATGTTRAFVFHNRTLYVFFLAGVFFMRPVEIVPSLVQPGSR